MFKTLLIAKSFCENSRLTKTFDTHLLTLLRLIHVFLFLKHWIKVDGNCWRIPLYLNELIGEQMISWNYLKFACDVPQNKLMVISICSLMEPNWKIHLRSHCRYFKSYQDDINSVWSGGAEALNCFFWQLNYKHPRIKFTLEREKMLTCHFLIYRLIDYPTDLSQRCILKTRILKSMRIGVAMYQKTANWVLWKNLSI